MALATGSRLGPYEILTPLGAGGMGEVYRARDTKLNREVAIKVLRPEVANDPDRLARFSREAHVLAALNHSHIAQIYGFDDSSGAPSLVMEFVDGPTLAEIISKSPLPVVDALGIAKQIADALQAAHEQGIVHRDLKPANIKVAPDGTVKVLDFGLAKALESRGAGPSTALGASQAGVASYDFTQSPTLTSPLQTQLGIILGTAAYMSPEQAKGKEADKRSDVWAFGCVLYEMLTGRPAFNGEDLTDTLGAVVRLEPDWSRLPPDLSPSVVALLKGCLVKDRRHRIADIAAASFALSHTDARLASPPTAASSLGSWWATVAVSCATLIVGAGVTALLVRSGPQQTSRVTRTVITGSGDLEPFVEGIDRDLAIAPDGSRVFYVAGHGTRLLARALDQLEPSVLVSSLALRSVFVSPDGRWVGYCENLRTLKKVSSTGGPPILVAHLDGGSRGAAWIAEDTIVFATANSTFGLKRVSAGGGESTPLTRPDREHGELAHIWPRALPGGKSVLFTITSEAGIDASQVAVLDVATGKWKTLIRGGSDAQYVETGHLVYAAGGTLQAIAFDLDRLETRGTPAPLVPRLITTSVGAADYSMAADGTLVYVNSPGNAEGRTVVWVDRQGKETPVGLPMHLYAQPRLSPKGDRLAIQVIDLQQDVWVWDIRLATFTRLTFGPELDQYPEWTRDGSQLLFASNRRGGPANLYVMSADGTGTAKQVTNDRAAQYPTGLTPDGSAVLLTQESESGLRDIMLIALGRGANSGPSQSQPVLATKADERNAEISPDGRWMVYESDAASGQLEVYVRPFPNVSDGQWQISTGGGHQPTWAPSGRELFYFALDGSMMAIDVPPQGTVWSAGNPRKLFEGRYITGSGLSRQFGLSADGQRFLMIRQGEPGTTATPQIVVVQHFFEELKAKVPAR